jgi:hypothetical protein
VPSVAVIAVATVVVVAVGVAYWQAWAWTGLTKVTRKDAAGADQIVRPAKTAWDWLQLLVVPLALAVLVFEVNSAQSKHDRRIAADGAREETLRTYLTQMSSLMLDRGLLRSKPRADVLTVARIATLTVVRRLDSERRGLVVRFLAEALRSARPRVGRACRHRSRARSSELDLRGADFSGADLAHAYLVRRS